MDLSGLMPGSPMTGEEQAIFAAQAAEEAQAAAAHAHETLEILGAAGITKDTHLISGTPQDSQSFIPRGAENLAGGHACLCTSMEALLAMVDGELTNLNSITKRGVECYNTVLKGIQKAIKESPIIPPLEKQALINSYNASRLLTDEDAEHVYQIGGMASFSYDAEAAEDGAVPDTPRGKAFYQFLTQEATDIEEGETKSLLCNIEDNIFAIQIKKSGSDITISVYDPHGKIGKKLFGDEHSVYAKALTPKQAAILLSHMYPEEGLITFQTIYAEEQPQSAKSISHRQLRKIFRNYIKEKEGLAAAASGSARSSPSLPSPTITPRAKLKRICDNLINQSRLEKKHKTALQNLTRAIIIDGSIDNDALSQLCNSFLKNSAAQKLLPQLSELVRDLSSDKGNDLIIIGFLNTFDLLTTADLGEGALIDRLTQRLVWSIDTQDLEYRELADAQIVFMQFLMADTFSYKESCPKLKAMVELINRCTDLSPKESHQGFLDIIEFCFSGVHCLVRGLMETKYLDLVSNLSMIKTEDLSFLSGLLKGLLSTLQKNGGYMRQVAEPVRNYIAVLVNTEDALTPAQVLEALGILNSLHLCSKHEASTHIKQLEAHSNNLLKNPTPLTISLFYAQIAFFKNFFPTESISTFNKCKDGMPPETLAEIILENIEEQQGSVGSGEESDGEGSIATDGAPHREDRSRVSSDDILDATIDDELAIANSQRSSRGSVSDHATEEVEDEASSDDEGSVSSDNSEISAVTDSTITLEDKPIEYWTQRLKDFPKSSFLKLLKSDKPNVQTAACNLLLIISRKKITNPTILAHFKAAIVKLESLLDSREQEKLAKFKNIANDSGEVDPQKYALLIGVLHHLFEEEERISPLPNIKLKKTYDSDRKALIERLSIAHVEYVRSISPKDSLIKKIDEVGKRSLMALATSGLKGLGNRIGWLVVKPTVDQKLATGKERFDKMQPHQQITQFALTILEAAKEEAKTKKHSHSRTRTLSTSTRGSSFTGETGSEVDSEVE